MIFNRTLEQIKSTDPIAQSLLNFRLQDSKPILRSNQYFNVLYERNAQGKQVLESIKIETKGLSDPKHTLLDKYALLNPFDLSIVNFQQTFNEKLSQLLRINNEEEQLEPNDENQTASQMPNIKQSKLDGESSTDSNISKSAQDLQTTDSNPKPEDVLKNRKLSEYNKKKQVQPTFQVSVPTTQSSRRRDHNSPQNQQIQQSAQQQQVNPIKGASCLLISLEFLYFVKKVTNAQLKNYHGKNSERQTTFYHWIRDFLITQFNKNNASKFNSINQSEIDALLNILSIHPKLNFQNIKNIHIHKYLQHTILHYIYQSHSISNIWTNEYETRLWQIRSTDAKVYNKLARFSKILMLMERQNNFSQDEEICRVFQPEGINLKKLNKTSILEDTLSGKLPPSKRVIKMVINNLHAFQYQDWHLTHQIISKTQLPSDPSSHTPIMKYPHLSIKYIQSGLKSNCHGLINLKTQSNQVVFLHQLTKPQKIFNDQTQMIQKIFEAIDWYHQLFSDMKDEEMFGKFSLFPVKSDSLIWNPWQNEVQIDKLEVLKLFFNLQTNPVAISHDLSLFTKKFPNHSAQSRLCNLLDQIHYEFKTLPSQFQLSTLPQNTKKLLAKDEASCLQMIPFAKVLIVVYATYHKSIERFLNELRKTTNKYNEQDGLLELLQIMNKKVKGTDKLEANGTNNQLDSQPAEKNNLEMCIDQIVELIQKRTKKTQK